MQMIKRGYGLPPFNMDGISTPDEKYLVSAKEARELSENSMSLECKNELKNTYKCIKKAIHSGEYYCWCNFYLHSLTINKLRKFGYKVTNYSTQRDGDSFKIEW